MTLSELPDGPPSLTATLDGVWRLLTMGRDDDGDRARFVALSTIGRKGPETRMVVLRKVNRAESRLTIFTEARSAKVRELASHPNASILAWDPDANLQARLRVRIAVRTGTEDEWSALSPRQQAAYGIDPPPGKVLDYPAQVQSQSDPRAFSILDADILEIETLRLGTPHQRALFLKSDDFSGGWLAP